ncbi:MAG: FAD-binding protein [Rubrivivax sp.]|jgi:3-oxo-5alpha-steroid 4-dehydrogenase
MSTAQTDTVTPIEAPLCVRSAAEVDWQQRAEVVVVGWGAAGACAAIEARQSGASVLVLDRFGGGGASTLSGGVVYAGGGTRQQREAGFEDTPQAMADYLRHEVQGVVSDRTLERFCQHSVANLEWLEGLGVRFGSRMPAHKTSYPPDGVFLYYSGNEVVPAYAGTAPPAPRGHRVVAKGQSGATLYAALQAATRASGARPLVQTAVRRLVRACDADGRPGRILGVQAWRLPEGDPRTARHAELDGLVAKWRIMKQAKAQAARLEAAAIEREIAQPVFIRATRAVVLASGGYVYNPALIDAHAPHYRQGWRIGGAGCDGSGLRLGQSVGGASQALANISGWRFITPPYAWPKGLVVNAAGERFCNEQVYGATLGHELVEHQGGKAWLVLDARLRRQAIRECLFGRLWAFQSLPALAMMLLAAKKSPTIDALATQIGAEPARLRASVEAANAAAHGERDDPFGKSVDMRQVCADGPFYALNISIGAKTFPLATLSLGGLRVNEDDGHVLDESAADIPGLFAAGRSAIGLPSGRYVSGLSLADCVFSGRRAGHAAAAEQEV